MQIIEGEFNLQIDDGSFVNVFEEGGPDAFLRGTSLKNMTIFSSVVSEIKEILKKAKKKKKVNAADKGKLKGFHNFLVAVSGHSTFTLFDEKVPASEIQCWLEFTIDEIKRFTAMPKWINTGTLEKHDMDILQTCMSMFNQANVVRAAFGSGFFRALGDMVKVRKGNNALMPADDVGEIIALVIANGYYTTRSKFGDNSWPSERGFRKLDDCGVLEEFLRCATVPNQDAVVDTQISDTVLKLTFDELQACMVILQQRFKKTDACGKVVHTILAGKDGRKPPRAQIFRRLQEIAKSLNSMDQPSGELVQTAKTCRKCLKCDPSEAFQKSLMRCARCQSAYYCSKACQKADWKTHKMACEPTSKATQKRDDAIEELLKNFIQNQYVDIMAKMVDVSEKTGVAKKDLLVFLDFCVNEDGIVPAMQDPPVFEVHPTQRFLDPSFSVRGPKYERGERIQNRINTVRDQYRKMTSRNTLFFIAYEGRFLANRIEL